MRKYHVYIMSNVSRTLYIGMTGDLEQRVFQHKQKVNDSFTAKYNVTQLVWFDEFDDVHQAIEGEKKLKGWRRSRKIDLIELTNPDWKDLAANWFDKRERPKGAADGHYAARKRSFANRLRMTEHCHPERSGAQ